jgi:hypothetical protein
MRYHIPEDGTDRSYRSEDREINQLVRKVLNKLVLLRQEAAVAQSE